MSTKSPIILILGAGPNIGQSVARLFSSKGYKVGLAARSIQQSESTETQLNISSDFSKTSDIIKAFDKIKNVFGVPSVVVYNADFQRDTTINIHSAFVAAQEAVRGFKQLNIKGTFIYTGNVTNVAILPKFLSQGVAKSGAASMIWAASEAYKDVGYKFYYVDERKADGSPKYRIDGDAHAGLFLELANGEKQGPWMQAFVKGEGYKEFETIYTPLK